MLVQYRSKMDCWACVPLVGDALEPHIYISLLQCSSICLLLPHRTFALGFSNFRSVPWNDGLLAEDPLRRQVSDQGHPS